MLILVLKNHAGNCKQRDFFFKSLHISVHKSNSWIFTFYFQFHFCNKHTFFDCDISNSKYVTYYLDENTRVYEFIIKF